jgi:dTMP kinase
MKKGSFIVLEGTDASGKATQLELLKKKLKKLGFEVKTDDYPRYYSSSFGKIAGRFLKGEFGKINDVSPWLAVLPYMIDEYIGGRNDIKRWVGVGKIVLSNRYFTSNVHQVAKLHTRAKAKFRRWLWSAGYEELGIYKPHLVIVLVVPPQISRKLNLKKSRRRYLKGKKQDIHEKNLAHQRAAYREYLYMCSQEKDWVKVSCCDRSGSLLTPREIHQKITMVLRNRKIL